MQDKQILVLSWKSMKGMIVWCGLAGALIVDCVIRSGCAMTLNHLFFRILDSCNALMKAIRVLILKSKDLQGEIVEEGMVIMSSCFFVMSTNFPFRKHFDILFFIFWSVCLSKDVLRYFRAQQPRKSFTSVTTGGQKGWYPLQKLSDGVPKCSCESV